MKFRADKNLGQHFLKDKNVIDKILAQLPTDAKSIIEVGPGPGALTERLSKINLPLFLLEKDERFIEHLSQFTPADQIQLGDALKHDYPALFAGKIQTPIWLVSNLPYNVAVPLMRIFLEYTAIENMTLMMQLEVGEKILPKPGQKNPMSSLYALFQNYFEVTKVVKALPGAFHPPPEVDSIVLHFKRRISPVIPLDQLSGYESFLRALFSAKRKQLGKVLSTHYSPKPVKQILESHEISPQLRAESLSLPDVIKLFTLIH